MKTQGSVWKKITQGTDTHHTLVGSFPSTGWGLILTRSCLFPLRLSPSACKAFQSLDRSSTVMEIGPFKCGSFAKQVFNLQLAFSATQHASGWLAVSAGTCGVFKECKFASVLPIAKQHNRRIRVRQGEGHAFPPQTKINIWELCVMAPLDFERPWHFSVAWVIVCSRFNLYTQAHTDFR